MQIITQNGQKTVEIKAAGFKEAINLKKAAAKCLLDAGITKDMNFQGLDISLLIDKGLELLASAEMSTDFENALFECLKSCYTDENGIKNKITRELFDEKPDLREDYYEIVSKCVEVNLRPFFKSLVTEFKARFSQMSENLPLKSVPIPNK